MNDQHLLYRVEDGIGTITINREQQRNAITPEAIDLFHAYLDQAEKDELVRALLITGAGDKAFCTGAQLAGGMATEGKDVFGYYASLLNRLASFPKPTVARIKGFCLAGGMGFMLACDIVIAADDAKFGTPEVNVGLWPMMIGALIFRNVLQKKAMEMILLGERMTAQEALAMGLITRVVPVGNLDEEVNKRPQEPGFQKPDRDEDRQTGVLRSSEHAVERSPELSFRKAQGSCEHGGCPGRHHGLHRKTAAGFYRPINHNHWIGGDI